MPEAEADRERERERELAPAGERWITLGEDALPAVLASFQSVGASGSFLLVEIRNSVAVARVAESRLPLIARVMHEQYHRCAGFIAHGSLAEASAAATAAAAAETGPDLAVDYTLSNAAVVEALLAQVQAAKVRETIVTLSAYPTRHYTSPTGVEAASWLKALWQGHAQGRPDVTVELYQHAGFPQPSVILTIPGSTLASEVVVLGGHLDSISTFGAGAPGADDDASGIASLSEAIRVALAADYRPLRTVKFIAYAAEEVGLRGSSEIANAHKSTGVNVVGVLQLDMTNYKGSSVDVGLLTDRTSAAQNQFIGNLIDTYLDLTWASTQCGYACSDHVSWTNAGFPSSLPFEALMGQHNGAIHTANDTLAQSGGTAEHATKFTRIAIAYVAELAKGTLGGGQPPPEQPLAAVFDATLRAPACAAVGIGCDSGTLLHGRGNLGPEVNRPNTLHGSCADGASGTFHSDESNDRLKVVSVDGTRLAPGKTVRVEATVWAYATASADKLDLYHAASAASPSWTLLGTLTPPARGAQTLSATFTLPAGPLQAVRARFRYQGSAASCGTGAYDDHDDLVFAVGGGAPGDTTPPSVTLTAPAAGSTVGGTITLAATATDDTGVARVEFLVDGMAKGSDATAPFTLAWNTTTAASGAHVLQARAYDAAGNVGTSTSVSVTVSNSAPPVLAAYDATLRAPRCAAVGNVCDSGTLLDGRGSVGNDEPNRPNTINASCADGNSGAYHVDESNDRIRVLTTDGTSFAPGKQVRIEATVWAYSTASADRLDLYYTANALNPSWTFLTSITPPGSGARTLSATYTLPAGALQAVRARFRYQGSQSPCASGSYTDHDDLVFAVQ